MTPAPVVVVCVIAATVDGNGPVVTLRPADAKAVRDAVSAAIEQHLAAGELTSERSGYDATAAEIARLHGVSAAWVRAHAAALGGVRLGDGPKARHRFNVHEVAQRIASLRRTHHDARAVGGAEPRRSQRRRRRVVTTVPLLPIKGRPHT